MGEPVLTNQDEQPRHGRIKSTVRLHLDTGQEPPVTETTPLDQRFAEILQDPKSYSHDQKRQLVQDLIQQNRLPDVLLTQEYFSLDTGELFTMLMDSGNAAFIAMNLDRIHAVNQAELVQKLLNSDNPEGIDVLAAYIGKFSGLGEDVLDSLITAQKANRVVENLQAFEGVDKKVIFDKLMQSKWFESAAKMLGDLRGLSVEDAKRLIDGNEAHTVLQNMSSFADVDPNELAQYCVRDKKGRGMQLSATALANSLTYFESLDESIAFALVEQTHEYDKIVYYLDKFKDIDRVALANALMKEEAGYVVAENLEKFLGIDQQALVRNLVAKGQPSYIFGNVDKFTQLDRDWLADELITQRYALDLLVEEKDRVFADVVLTVDQMKYLLYQDNIEFALQLYTLYCKEKWPVMDAAIDIFGDYVSLELYEMVKLLIDGQMPEYDEYAKPGNEQRLHALASFGVRETGQKGLEQLQKRKKIVGENLLHNTEHKNDQFYMFLIQNPIGLAILKKMSRYDESQWGYGGDVQLERIIAKQRDLYRVGDVGIKKPGYTDSQPIEITTVEAKRKGKEDELFDKDAVERYGRLRMQLQAAAEMVGPDNNNTHPFSEKLTEISQYIDTKLEQLRATYQQLLDNGKPEAAAKLNDQIIRLQAVQERGLRTITDFEANFMALVGDKKLHDKISTLMFAWAMRFPPGGQSRARLEQVVGNIGILPKEPGVNSMSAVLDQIDHVINQEVFGHYFTTEEAKKAFADLTSTEALQKAIAKAQGKQKASGTLPIQFLPTRGLLMELSGHIADACWAEGYESIAESFPNITAVTIRQHPEGKHDRLVGSFLLIEAEAADGGPPLLIVRGLNPIENFVNKVDVEAFFSSVQAYVGELAQSMSRRAAIVIDDHCGGSGTNRPVLFGYMRGIVGQLRPITPTGSTEFNGYNIEQDTYLL